MDTKLKNIKDTSPNKKTIEVLEDLLEKAKQGELRSIVYASGYADSCSTGGWVMDGRSDVRLILTELHQLHLDLSINILINNEKSALSEYIKGDA